MEVIHTAVIIYTALCLRFTVILTGGQNIGIVKYRGENVNLVCDISVNIKFPNCQWNFTQNEGDERPLNNGTRYTWSCSQISINPPWVRSQISFNNATFNDSGIYACAVMTPTGANGRDLVLTVLAKLEITVHKTKYTALSGTNVTLECIVNANEVNIISIEWWYTFKKQWIQAEKTGKYFWTIQLPSLVISNVQTSDSRFYKCVASTDLDTAQGPDILLNVQNLPVVIVQKTQFFIAVGEDIVLNCSVNGLGIPIHYVAWYRRSSSSLIPLTNEAKYQWRQLGPDASIKIKKVIENDAGIYVCEGTTEVGSSKGNDIELRVGYKPTVTVNAYNYSTGEGYNLTLHCSIDGHGSTVKRVEWFKKINSQFIYLQPTTRVFWDISSPSMKINIVQLDDAGRYICIGVTEFGTTTSSQISVQIFSTPIFSIHVFEYTTMNGTTDVLEVRIDEKMQTLLSVQWEKYIQENQQWFPLENNSRLLWTYSEPSLRIATARVEDEGKYRISAKTAYHEVRSSPITINIYVPVKIKELETRPVLIRQDDTVRIRCLVVGRPDPKVTWRLANRTTILESNLKNVNENILILESVTKLNEGNYTCIAHNNFSRDESLIYLTVSDLPVFNPPNEDLTGSPLEKYVVPGVSVFVCVALIAVIVVVILIRRKRHKGRTVDKPNLEIRSTNGQTHPSPSETIRSGNNHSKFYVDLSGDMTYAQVIRKSSKNIDGSKSIRDADIPQSKTLIDGTNTIGDTDASQVYMNITNANAAVQQRSSTSNSNSCLSKETESENTQVNKTEELNYVELEFNSNAQDENSSLGIRGSPSDTTYTEVVVFTR